MERHAQRRAGGVAAGRYRPLRRVDGRQERRANRHDLWRVANLANGGASHDGFYYFRLWLVGMGKQVFEAALADPDSLADVLDPAYDMYEAEMYGAAPDAYEAALGLSFFEGRALYEAAEEKLALPCEDFVMPPGRMGFGGDRRVPPSPAPVIGVVRFRRGRMTLFLALETSCDETAAAVFTNEPRVLSSVVASQTDLHARFGGVVPESRRGRTSSACCPSSMRHCARPTSPSPTSAVSRSTTRRASSGRCSSA